MNYNDSSTPVLSTTLRRRFWQTLLTGCFLLLLAPAFAKAGPVADKPGPPYTITFIHLINNQIANGVAQDELQYRVTDPATGLPVSGEKVYFTTPSGTTQATTDAGGNAFFDLGNTSTSAAVPVTVTYNGPVAGGSFTFTWVPGPIDPSNPQTQITVDKSTAQPDGSDFTKITVHLFDAYGNPVTGVPVNWTIAGGSAAGTAIISPGLSGTSGTSGATAGTHSITIKNFKSGDVNFTVVANGISVTNGSPAIVHFVATVPDPTNPATRVIVDVPTVQPDGVSHDVLHAHITDNLGNPVVGATVAWTIAGGSASATAFVTVLNATTNASGDAIINVSNIKAGEVDFTATVNGVPISYGIPSYPAKIYFVATTPSTANPLTAIIVDVSPVQPDGSTPDKLHAHIVDANGNTITGAIVVFTITGGSASGTAAPSAVTDQGNGDYSINVTNTKSGTVLFTATVNGLSITNGSPATVKFVATTPDVTNPATALFVDVTNQAPDGASADIIHAHVVGVNSNPVPGQTVVFTISGGTAAATAVVSSVVDDGAGNYTIKIYNTKAGTVNFTATVNGLNITNGSPATATFVATTPSTANPLTAIIVDISPSPPDGATADILHAHIVDANSNPVSGLNNVSFLVTGGTASGTAVVSAVTDMGGGNYQIKVTNTLAGTVTFTASVGGQAITNGSPATIKFVATTPSPANPATKLIVDVPSAPADGSTVTTIHAHVVDANGNTVNAATVVFTISGGTAAGTAVVSAVTADGAGNYTINITNTKTGTVTFTATANGLNITNGSPAMVTFTNTPPNPANPATQLVVDITNQAPDGVSKDVIHAHVVDGGGNIVIGGTVVFTISGGTAMGTAVVSGVTDNGNGNYTITIANTKSGTVSFTATANGIAITNGSPAVATFVATTPDPTNPATKLVVDVPTAPDDGTTPATIHAHVVDANGNTVNAATVVFTISGGTAAGTAVVSAVTADGAGNYTINITNTKTGTVTFTATANGSAITNGSPATVTFVKAPPSTANPATKLVVDISPVQPDGSSKDVLHAHIENISGDPIIGATVVFSIAGGSASATAVVSSVVDNGNGNYTITVTNTKSGTVNFTATVNGQSITNNSPAVVSFVATVPNPADPATQLVVDVPSAPDNGVTPTVIHAHVAGVGGNPVPGQNVVFTISGGTAAATAAVSSVTDDGQGNYIIKINNTVPGTVSFTATVNGQPITNNSPATVTFTTSSPSTGNPGTKLVVDIPTVQPDGVSQDVLHAAVADASGFPYVGGTVVFTVSGGSAAATAVVSGVTDNKDGTYTIKVTNTKEGDVIFTATVNGQLITNNSPATIHFVSTTPAPSNPATQVIVDIPSAPDDGASSTVIRVHVVDAGGNVVNSASVVFTITGGTASASATVGSVSAAGNGDYIVKVTNTSPGTVTFTATANNLAVVNGAVPATVTFSSGPPDPTNPATKLIVDITGVTADGTSSDVIHAHLADANGYAVSGATVAFTISGGTAAGTAVVSNVVDNGNGNYVINILNKKAGSVIFTATENGKPITNNSPATVTFVAGAPSATGGKTLLSTITDNNVADGHSTDSVKAYITDLNGNPVANTTVTFTIEAGGTAGATAKFMENVTVTTDANGIATIGIANTVAGTVNIGAYVGGTAITGSPLLITFVNAPDVTNINTNLTVVIYEALADGQSTTQVRAHVVDQNGNPISDRTIQFSIDSGTATFTSPNPALTDNNGDAIIILTSKTPGYVLITATVDGKKIIFGSPARVYFTPINIYVPRVFTPNNDGTNDILKPILVGMSAFHYFSIYNRWGNLIFTTQDPNQGWDGTFKGVQQPVETYLWIAEGIDVNGRKVVQRGMTSLVR